MDFKWLVQIVKVAHIENTAQALGKWKAICCSGQLFTLHANPTTCLARAQVRDFLSELGGVSPANFGMWIITFTYYLLPIKWKLIGYWWLVVHGSESSWLGVRPRPVPEARPPTPPINHALSVKLCINWELITKWGQLEKHNQVIDKNRKDDSRSHTNNLNWSYTTASAFLLENMPRLEIHREHLIHILIFILCKDVHNSGLMDLV